MGGTIEGRREALTTERRRLFEGALDLLAEKAADDERRIGVEFPHVTEPDGRWRTWPASVSAGYTGQAWSHGNWTCGFWVGLLVAAHLRTGEPRFLAWALERMRLVAPRADDPNTHDLGFLFSASALPLLRVTGERWCGEVALAAADRLRSRLVTTRAGAYLSSWGPLSDPRGRASSAIDTMANLPLLYWAADERRDGSFRLAAEAHARKTADALVRADGFTCHAVEYDPASGARLRGYTLQGLHDESRWSRGQAWAIYGYVASARATGDHAYLRLAERLADAYLAALGDSVVPPWDLDDRDPGRPEDSSAAAVVASALLDLGALHPDPEMGRRFEGRAVATLEGLCRDYLARDPSHRGLLRHGCYSRPHGDGVDSAVLFGDFYFVEALAKAVLPGRLVPAVEGRLTAAPSGH